MSFNRRSFLKNSAIAGLGISLANIPFESNSEDFHLEGTAPFPRAFKKHSKVRMAFIGVGGMGTAHVRNFVKIPNVEVKGICDIVEERAVRAQNICYDAGLGKPELYTNDENDYKRLCQRDDIDLIYIATPWKWHVPMCMEAMENGKHAATEVPAALTIEECWMLVEESEKTGLHCIMMENCNYDKTEMIILNMVKQGLLGELVHAQCGYLHDLRAVKHDMNGEGVWRRHHSMVRNGDLYPTHGLAPIAQCMDINRGNQFDYLVAFASKSRGLHEYAVERFGQESDQALEVFTLGDVVTTMIKTMHDETIIVTHDTSLPRPYSRDIFVQGTEGVVRKYPTPKIFIEGKSPAHRWEELSIYKDEYYHPLWKKLEKESKGAGHGGMDFLEDYRLIDAMVKGRPPDMDVYDAAAISSITALSEKSINAKGMPQKCPDFTRGMWKTPRELEVMKMGGKY